MKNQDGNRKMEEHEEKTGMNEQELAVAAAETCERHKGQDIILYDLKQSSMLADYYLICSGTSEPHLRALAGHLEKEMAKHQIRPRHVDGSPASRWIVIDYGYLMVHIFLPAMRQYYEIEKLWQGTTEILYRGGNEETDEPVPIF